MATQTRRTTRRSARFFRATVKASMVTACCGLVLLSAVAAHAGVDWNGLPMNGIPLNGLPINGMPLNGLLFNGITLNGMPMNGVPLQWNTSMGCLSMGRLSKGCERPCNGLTSMECPPGMPHNALPSGGRSPRGRRSNYHGTP